MAHAGSAAHSSIRAEHSSSERSSSGSPPRAHCTCHPLARVSFALLPSSHSLRFSRRTQLVLGYYGWWLQDLLRRRVACSARVVFLGSPSGRGSPPNSHAHPFDDDSFYVIVRALVVSLPFSSQVGCVVLQQRSSSRTSSLV